MRHHPEHVAALVDDAGYIALAAVRIGARRHVPSGRAVAEDDAAGGLQFGQGSIIRCIAALPVRYRHAQKIPGRATDREWGVGVLDAKVHPLAAILQGIVAHERTGQEVGLAQYLEAVADADDRLALFHVTPDSDHHRREAGDGARSQVVAVREAARQHDAVVGGEVALPVPDEVRLVPHHPGERVLAVAVAPGAGKDDDGEAHAETVISRMARARNWREDEQPVSLCDPKVRRTATGN